MKYILSVMKVSGRAIHPGLSRCLLCLLAGAFLSLLPARSQLAADSLRISLGTLSEDDPPQTCVFRCTNITAGPLHITAVKTTCGCTAATVADTLLAPGQQTVIRAVYTPLGHPGRVLAYIDVFTSATVGKPSLTLSLTGRVTPSAALWKEYRYAMGELRLRRRNIVFEAPFSGKHRIERIVCANAGSTPLRLTADKISLPPWLIFRTVPAVIPPGEEAVIELEADVSQLPATLSQTTAKVLLEGVKVPPTERMIEVTIKK